MCVGTVEKKPQVPPHLFRVLTRPLPPDLLRRRVALMGNLCLDPATYEAAVTITVTAIAWESVVPWVPVTTIV